MNSYSNIESFTKLEVILGTVHTERYVGYPSNDSESYNHPRVCRRRRTITVLNKIILMFISLANTVLLFAVHEIHLANSRLPYVDCREVGMMRYFLEGSLIIGSELCREPGRRFWAQSLNVYGHFGLNW